MTGPLKRLRLMLEEFRKMNPEMQMQTAMTFLLIADAGPSGMNQGDLVQHLGVVKSAVSRNCALLGEGRGPGRPGYGLIHGFENPENRRARILILTPKGRRVAHSLEAILADA